MDRWTFTSKRTISKNLGLTSPTKELDFIGGDPSRKQKAIYIDPRPHLFTVLEATKGNIITAHGHRQVSC